jgi:hypothetical protein
VSTKPAAAHWDKFKGAKQKPKHWYSLCSSATDIRRLAQLLGRESEYVLLYKMLSESAHAANVFSGVLSRTEERTLEMHKLRGPVEKIKESTSLTANYLAWSHNLLLDTYLKGHAVQNWFTKWYIEDYRSGFMWAISPTPLFSAPPPAS